MTGPAPGADSAAFKRALELDARADAVVLADRKISHGDVAELLDRIKQAGLTQVALGVEQKAGGR